MHVQSFMEKERKIQGIEQPFTVAIKVNKNERRTNRWAFEEIAQKDSNSSFLVFDLLHFKKKGIRSFFTSYSFQKLYYFDLPSLLSLSISSLFVLHRDDGSPRWVMMNEWMRVTHDENGLLIPFLIIIIPVQKSSSSFLLQASECLNDQWSKILICKIFLPWTRG